jgi:hypothetical protein
VELALRRRGLQRVGHIIAAVAAVVAVATVAGALTLRLGGIGVGHDDRLKDVLLVAGVFSGPGLVFRAVRTLPRSISPNDMDVQSTRVGIVPKKSVVLTSGAPR